jgi:hypothetical protein
MRLLLTGRRRAHVGGLMLPPTISPRPSFTDVSHARSAFDVFTATV